MNNSLWTATAKNKVAPMLQEDLDCDILIIGGGITGLNCAYQLEKVSKNIVLVEANTIGSGVTSKTTGKITYLQGNYTKINEKVGFDNCLDYYNSQLLAINTLKEIIKTNAMNCELVESPSYLFNTNSENNNQIEEEYNLLKKMNAPVSLIEKDSKMILKGENNYTFHPLKYLFSLKQILIKKNIKIYEHSRVTSLQKVNSNYKCTVNGFNVNAKTVVLATHYPFFLKPYFFPLKVTLEKSYVAAKKCEKFNYNALTMDKPTISIRNYTNRRNSYKIFLYGSHNLAFQNNLENNFDNLLKEFPDPEYLWSNIDIITGDYLPIIGKFDSNLYVSTGYNTWGMTNSVLGSLIIKDLIAENENKYLEITSPKRDTVASILKALLATTKSFTEELLFPTKSWYNGKIHQETRDGEDVFVYIDSKNQEHVVKSKCPHLKCGLTFNETEKTWDCPCHGSRFDLDGKCIEGPSNEDISIDEKDIKID